MPRCEEQDLMLIGYEKRNNVALKIDVGMGSRKQKQYFCAIGKGNWLKNNYFSIENERMCQKKKKISLVYEILCHFWRVHLCIGRWSL